MTFHNHTALEKFTQRSPSDIPARGRGRRGGARDTWIQTKKKKKNLKMLILLGFLSCSHQRNVPATFLSPVFFPTHSSLQVQLHSTGHTVSVFFHCAHSSESTQTSALQAFLKFKEMSFSLPFCFYTTESL